jgi:hypothetical protein
MLPSFVEFCSRGAGRPLSLCLVVLCKASCVFLNAPLAPSTLLLRLFLAPHFVPFDASFAYRFDPPDAIELPVFVIDVADCYCVIWFTSADSHSSCCHTDLSRLISPR